MAFMIDTLGSWRDHSRFDLQNAEPFLELGEDEVNEVGGFGDGRMK